MLPQVVNGYEWEGVELEVIKLNDEPLFGARSVAAALAISDGAAASFWR